MLHMLILWLTCFVDWLVLEEKLWTSTTQMRFHTTVMLPHTLTLFSIISLFIVVNFLYTMYLNKCYLSDIVVLWP